MNSEKPARFLITEIMRKKETQDRSRYKSADHVPRQERLPKIATWRIDESNGDRHGPSYQKCFSTQKQRLAEERPRPAKRGREPPAAGKEQGQSKTPRHREKPPSKTLLAVFRNLFVERLSAHESIVNLPKIMVRRVAIFTMCRTEFRRLWRKSNAFKSWMISRRRDWQRSMRFPG
jgi:hypothetical protein